MFGRTTTSVRISSLNKFLNFWLEKLEGPLHSVTVAHARLIKPAEIRAVDGEFPAELSLWDEAAGRSGAKAPASRPRHCAYVAGGGGCRRWLVRVRSRVDLVAALVLSGGYRRGDGAWSQ